jgi:ribosomal protein S6
MAAALQRSMNGVSVVGILYRSFDEGYYVVINFEGDTELPKELERNFRIDESIIRFLVVRIED